MQDRISGVFFRGKLGKLGYIYICKKQKRDLLFTVPHTRKK